MVFSQCFSCAGEPQTGRSTSNAASLLPEKNCFGLLAALFLIEPNMQLFYTSARTHCWIMFGLSTGTHKSFSAKLFATQHVPSLQYVTFIFVQLHKVSTSFPQFDTVCILAEGALHPMVQPNSNNIKQHPQHQALRRTEIHFFFQMWILLYQTYVIRTYWPGCGPVSRLK